eukprot:8045356-Alexandrium_andersonii.AAC.1
MDSLVLGLDPFVNVDLDVCADALRRSNTPRRVSLARFCRFTVSIIGKPSISVSRIGAPCCRSAKGILETQPLMIL